jgi:hypothetical protein
MRKNSGQGEVLLELACVKIAAVNSEWINPKDASCETYCLQLSATSVSGRERDTTSRGIFGFVCAF